MPNFLAIASAPGCLSGQQVIEIVLEDRSQQMFPIFPLGLCVC
jgi:hypothetical protein